MRLAIQERDRHLAGLRNGTYRRRQRTASARGVPLAAREAPLARAEPLEPALNPAPTPEIAVPNPLLEAMNRVRSIIARGKNFLALAGREANKAGLDDGQRKAVGLGPRRKTPPVRKSARGRASNR